MRSVGDEVFQTFLELFLIADVSRDQKELVAGKSRDLDLKNHGWVDRRDDFDIFPTVWIIQIRRQFLITDQVAEFVTEILR